MEFILAGIQLYEFDVGLSDILLALLCLYFFITLFRKGVPKSVSLIFFGLTFSAFFGAIFHLFFPLKTETFGGLFIWSIVATSIGFIIFGIMQFLLGKMNISSFYTGIIIFVYEGFFLLYFFFVSYGYTGIILFYAPIVMLLGAYGIRRYIFSKKLCYLILFTGVLLSIGAGVIQLTHFTLHDIYLTYNTMYHIVQGLGLFCIYYYFLGEKYEG